MCQFFLKSETYHLQIWDCARSRLEDMETAPNQGTDEPPAKRGRHDDTTDYSEWCDEDHEESVEDEVSRYLKDRLQPVGPKEILSFWKNGQVRNYMTDINLTTQFHSLKY